jgi:starch phosphorylase
MAPEVAYFSMEIGIEPAMPTYAGGLGILAGDTLRGAADLGLPMVGVSLVHRRGYFRQRLDDRGVQSEEPLEWRPETMCELMPQRVAVTIENRTVEVAAWRYMLRGLGGVVPIYLLDSSDPRNDGWDRTLTDSLYGGDERYRLAQEAILGFGGVAMLAALGHDRISTYHMNEGHSALLAIGLLLRRISGSAARVTDADMEDVRRHCVFTTHTPVPAGHDQFPRELAERVLGPAVTAALDATGCCVNHTLNMTYLALRCSHYVNGVGMQHGEISRDMFPNYPIRAITNGVHAVSWVAPALAALYDRHLPEWRRDNAYLRYGINIPLAEIGEAHRSSKRALLEAVAGRTGVSLDERVFTIGFARRASAYKRADLVFSNIERVKWISQRIGRMQLVFGGKAHPRDQAGKDLIRSVFAAASALRGVVPVVYVEDYDTTWARLMTSGVDLWLNTPQRPLEASGTSGMKAALNGVPSLSVLDGWWVEGHVEGVTGWSIGQEEEATPNPAVEAASLYDKLEMAIVPLFYDRPDAFTALRRSTIALNGSFFNSHRMLMQYIANAYAGLSLHVQPEPVPVVAG